MIQNTRIFSVISGFRREVAENLALLGYYAASRISTTRHVITQKSEVITRILNSNFPLLCSSNSPGHFAGVVSAIGVPLMFVLVAYVIATYVKQFFRSQSSDKWSFA